MQHDETLVSIDNENTIVQENSVSRLDFSKKTLASDLPYNLKDVIKNRSNQIENPTSSDEELVKSLKKRNETYMDRNSSEQRPTTSLLNLLSNNIRRNDESSESMSVNNECEIIMEEFYDLIKRNTQLERQHSRDQRTINRLKFKLKCNNVPRDTLLIDDLNAQKLNNNLFFSNCQCARGFATILELLDDHINDDVVRFYNAEIKELRQQREKLYTELLLARQQISQYKCLVDKDPILSLKLSVQNKDFEQAATDEERILILINTTNSLLTIKEHLLGQLADERSVRRDWQFQVHRLYEKLARSLQLIAEKFDDTKECKYSNKVKSLLKNDIFLSSLHLNDFITFSEYESMRIKSMQDENKIRFYVNKIAELEKKYMDIKFNHTKDQIFSKKHGDDSFLSNSDCSWLGSDKFHKNNFHGKCVQDLTKETDDYIFNCLSDKHLSSNFANTKVTDLIATHDTNCKPLCKRSPKSIMINVAAKTNSSAKTSQHINNNVYSMQYLENDLDGAQESVDNDKPPRVDKLVDKLKLDLFDGNDNVNDDLSDNNSNSNNVYSPIKSQTISNSKASSNNDLIKQKVLLKNKLLATKKDISATITKSLSILPKQSKINFLKEVKLKNATVHKQPIVSTDDKYKITIDGQRKDTGEFYNCEQTQLKQLDMASGGTPSVSNSRLNTDTFIPTNIQTKAIDKKLKVLSSLSSSVHNNTADSSFDNTVSKTVDSSNYTNTTSGKKTRNLTPLLSSDSDVSSQFTDHLVREELTAEDKLIKAALKEKTLSKEDLILRKESTLKPKETTNSANFLDDRRNIPESSKIYNSDSMRPSTSDNTSSKPQTLVLIPEQTNSTSTNTDAYQSAIAVGCKASFSDDFVSSKHNTVTKTPLVRLISKKYLKHFARPLVAGKKLPTIPSLKSISSGDTVSYVGKKLLQTHFVAADNVRTHIVSSEIRSCDTDIAVLTRFKLYIEEMKSTPFEYFIALENKVENKQINQSAFVEANIELFNLTQDLRHVFKLKQLFNFIVKKQPIVNTTKWLVLELSTLNATDSNDSLLTLSQLYFAIYSLDRNYSGPKLYKHLSEYYGNPPWRISGDSKIISRDKFISICNNTGFPSQQAGKIWDNATNSAFNYSTSDLFVNMLNQNNAGITVDKLPSNLKKLRSVQSCELLWICKDRWQADYSDYDNKVWCLKSKLLHYMKNNKLTLLSLYHKLANDNNCGSYYEFSKGLDEIFGPLTINPVVKDALFVSLCLPIQKTLTLSAFVRNLECLIKVSLSDYRRRILHLIGSPQKYTNIYKDGTSGPPTQLDYDAFISFSTKLGFLVDQGREIWILLHGNTYKTTSLSQFIRLALDQVSIDEYNDHLKSLNSWTGRAILATLPNPTPVTDISYYTYESDQADYSIHQPPYTIDCTSDDETIIQNITKPITPTR